MLNNYYAIKVLLDEQHELFLNQAKIDYNMKKMDSNSRVDNYWLFIQEFLSRINLSPGKEVPVVEMTNCNATPECQVC